jgi:glycosyltransferase involved in cell wall biosynthesis
MNFEFKKKVVCVSDHSNFLGGGEYSFFDLCRSLNSNHQAIAVVPLNGALSRALKTYEIKTYFNSFSSLKPHLIFSAFRSGMNLLRLIGKIKPDLIYTNGTRSALYCSILKHFHKKPVIWHCRVSQKALIADLVLKRFCDCIVANSKATQRRFRKKYKSKVPVVYNGFDLKWLNEPATAKPELLKDGWQNILVSARVSQWKRHDLVLSAFEIIAAQHPEAHVILIGARDPLEPEWWRFLQQKTKGSKFAERIHWVGHVKDVRPWYQAADMLVLASDNEPFGRVIVEAMAVGLPVIATRNGGIPEIITDNVNGLLVNSGDPEDLAGSINRLLLDKNLREQLARNGKNRSKQFDLKLHIGKMAEIFSQFINN